jgi:phage terminase small subunit
MSKLEDLDPKRRRFVEEYAVDWNATQAAIRAGRTGGVDEGG